MLNYILKPIRHQSFFKKYASKKYLKVCVLSVITLYSTDVVLLSAPQASIFVRDWALARWEEGVQVSLQTELPALREIIREQRALEEEQMLAAQEQGDSDGEVFQA